MTGFQLSPGITPGLVSAFSVELPLALGLGYLVARALGFEIALAGNGVVLGLIKLWTDYTDSFDALLAVTVVAVSVCVLALAATRRDGWGAIPRAGLLLVGLYAIPFGLIKIASDFFDPFDTFLSDIAVLAGVLVIATALSLIRGQGRLRWREAGLMAVTEGLLLVLLVIIWRGFGWPWLLEATLPPVAVLALFLSRLRPADHTHAASSP